MNKGRESADYERDLAKQQEQLRLDMLACLECQIAGRHPSKSLHIATHDTPQKKEV